MSWSSIWRRWTRGERHVEHQADWERFAGPDFADHILTQSLTDRQHAKQGRDTGRWVLTAENEKLVVYVKRHRVETWWRCLLALLWPTGGWSAARAESRNLAWAASAGIPVPPTVAVGEFVGPGLSLQSFLVIQELTGYLPLHEAIPRAAQELSSPDFTRWKRELTAAVADVCRKLHSHGRFHRDLYLCHFFVQPADADARLGPVFLIDFHRLRRQRLTAWYARLKDLAQLHFSSDVPGVTDRDRLRFALAYLGHRRACWWHRLFVRLVIGKSRRYHKHNAEQHAAAGRDVAARF